MFIPFTTTGIGSLPHTNPEMACRLILENVEIPFWPQLPKLSFHESMIVQFSEGIPCIKIDNQKESIWIETERPDDLVQFYETFSDELNIPISEDYAKGFYAFIKEIKGKQFKYLKGQITGPLTYTLSLKDSKGKPVYFNEEFREISLLTIKAKTRWQINKLAPYSEHIVIFIDEPILSSLGSTSYLGVDTEDSLRLLRELSDTIRHAGGIPGIHCCGRADWPLALKSGASIISFDAYEYIDTISLYPSEFTDFLKGGGYLAWGIIPTTSSIHKENPDSIRKQFDRAFDRLSKTIQTPLLLSQILLTPSCGTGSMSIDETTKVFNLLSCLRKVLS